MKKQLDVNRIQSELSGGSAFFPGYKGSSSPTRSDDAPDDIDHAIPAKNPADHQPTPPPTMANKADVSEGVPPPVPRTVPRTGSRTPPLAPKIKRPIRQRQPFDIYEDQYTELKQIADKERGFINGRGMSQMVREAIDVYLNTNRSSNS